MMKSRRILYFSFLLALLPVFLEWFRVGSPGIRPPCRGIYLVRGEFYFAVALYYVMLFLKKMEHFCDYCENGTALDDGQILCARKGLRTP